MVGSYVLSTHRGLPATDNTYEYRAFCDIEDIMKGSLHRDLDQLRQLAGLILSRSEATDPLAEQINFLDELGLGPDQSSN
jgi:hypothetical protein